MTKFIFKSNASDLQKISQSIETVQKNVLYLTYQVDWIRKTLKEAQTNKVLQTQVDDFYEDNTTDAVHPDDKQDLD